MKKGILFLLLVILAVQAPVCSNEILVLNSPKVPSGFFNNFLIVLGFLKYCEKTDVKDFTIDFKTEGLYYDSEYGSNWWEYYFEPIKEERLSTKLLKPLFYKEKRISEYLISFFSYHSKYLLDRAKAHRLIKKWIRIKPEISEEVNQFCKENFSGYHMIGVHYRGTDHMRQMQGCAVPEGTFVSFEDVFEQIDLCREKKDKERIFIATDSDAFLQAALNRYGNRICYTKAMRSKDETPLHYELGLSRAKNPYQRGKEALIDSVLLSKCDVLLKTASHLSLCSSYFNPKMPVVYLSQKRPHSRTLAK